MSTRTAVIGNSGFDPNAPMLEAGLPKAPAAVTYVIYRAVDAFGKTQYIGMTMDFLRRRLNTLIGLI
jgi:hypothetical protein